MPRLGRVKLKAQDQPTGSWGGASMEHRPARGHHQLRVRLPGSSACRSPMSIADAPKSGWCFDAQARAVLRSARSRRAAQWTVDPRERYIVDQRRVADDLPPQRPAGAALFVVDLMGGLHDARAGGAACGLRRAGPLLCRVRAVDGLWELGLRPRDIAAGTLIVTEAGGRSSDQPRQIGTRPRRTQDPSNCKLQSRDARGDRAGVPGSGSA